MPHSTNQSKRLTIGMDITAGLHAGGTDGNSAVILSLARALANIADTGEFDLQLYVPPGTAISGINPKWLRFIPSLPLCSAEHRRIRYGLSTILCGDPPDVFLNVASSYQPRFSRSRQICIVYDVAFAIDQWRSYYTTELAAHLFENTNNAVQRAQVVVAISQRSATDVEQIFRIPAERIRVIHPGYDRDRFHPAKGELDAKLAEKIGEDPFFLAVGTIQPRKNYELLIRSFVRFRAERGPKYRLLIVGAAGWLAEPILKLADAHATDGVVLWGTAERAEVAPLMRAATAFVFPALYEGFGIPLVEAMACATPVISSNTGPLPEVAGDAALLFDPHSEEQLAAAMLRVAESHETRSAMSSRSLRRAGEFSWDKAAEAYAKLAQEVALQ